MQEDGEDEGEAVGASSSEERNVQATKELQSANNALEKVVGADIDKGKKSEEKEQSVPLDQFVVAGEKAYVAAFHFKQRVYYRVCVD